MLCTHVASVVGGSSTLAANPHSPVGYPETTVNHSGSLLVQSSPTQNPVFREFACGVFLGPHPHRTRDGTRSTRKLECFSFYVACMQCGHPHSHQQVLFACIALCVASCILCGLGLRVWGPGCCFIFQAEEVSSMSVGRPRI